jgi:hypothetical protein
MMWFAVVCTTAWLECSRPQLVPQAQCQSLINMSMKDYRVMCVTETGEVRRQQELASRD